MGVHVQSKTVKTVDPSSASPNQSLIPDATVGKGEEAELRLYLRHRSSSSRVRA